MPQPSPQQRIGLFVASALAVDALGVAGLTLRAHADDPDRTWTACLREQAGNVAYANTMCAGPLLAAAAGVEAVNKRGIGPLAVSAVGLNAVSIFVPALARYARSRSPLQTSLSQQLLGEAAPVLAANVVGVGAVLATEAIKVALEQRRAARG